MYYKRNINILESTEGTVYESSLNLGSSSCRGNNIFYCFRTFWFNIVESQTFKGDISVTGGEVWMSELGYKESWAQKNWCGVGEDSWESLGLRGDPTSPS